MSLTNVTLKNGKKMTYSKEIIDFLFPFLQRPIHEEWELIKEKKSALSSQKRRNITELCSKLEKA